MHCSVRQLTGCCPYCSEARKYGHCISQCVFGSLLAGPRSKKAKDHRGLGPDEPTPRPVVRSSPGLTQQRSDGLCGSYVDGSGGSWLSFLASKVCYSCLFLSSGFIRSEPIPHFLFHTYICPLLPLVSTSSFPLFPPTLGFKIPSAI